MLFRVYEERDLEEMHALDEACFGPPFRFSLRAMRRFAGADHAATILAEEDGRLAGFVVAHRVQDAVYIVTVDVAEEYRRRGVGLELMQRAEQAFAGVRRVDLHVYTGNEAAIRFYERMGYRRTGVAPGFYGRDLNGWVYAKALG